MPEGNQQTDRGGALVPIDTSDVAVYEAASLKALEAVIEKGLEHEADVLKAYVVLALIHDRKLYGRSFERYATDRFGISRATAHRWLATGRAIMVEIRKTGETSDMPSQRQIARQSERPKVSRGETVLPASERDGSLRTAPADPAPPIVDAPSAPTQAPAPTTTAPPPTRPDRAADLKTALAVVAESADNTYADVKTADLIRSYRYLGTVIAGRGDAPSDVMSRNEAHSSTMTLDSDTEKLISGVAAWASAQTVSFHDAVDRVLQRLQSVSSGAARRAVAAERQRPAATTVSCDGVHHPPNLRIGSVCTGCGKTVKGA